jgi:ketosteroid isomerase-like protein
MRVSIIAHLLLGVACVCAGNSTVWAAGTSPADAAPANVAPLDTLPADRRSAGLAAADLPTSPELAAFKKAIRAKYDLKERAFASHDAETIVTRFYSPDVISVGEGEGIYIGRDQIRPLYQDVVKSNQVKVQSIYTFVKGDAGWDWADFHVYPTDGKTKPFTFAILFLWARIEGQWMCKGDFFVTGSLKDGKLTAAPAPAGPK